MPGGKYDSSRTRVAPVFEKLKQRTDNWVADLLSLPQSGHPSAIVANELDLKFVKGNWGETEIGLAPAKSLLKWLASNPERLSQKHSPISSRQQLLDGDSTVRSEALQLIDRGQTGRGWHVFEGATVPDAVICTNDAIVVVEGKRTEAGATTDTTWLAGRHQMWRHIEAAWEMRGNKKVYGFFMVEGSDEAVPAKWIVAAQATWSSETLRSSFPHRNDDEIAELARCFLGITTWHAACSKFGFEHASLPHTTEECQD